MTPVLNPDLRCWNADEGMDEMFKELDEKTMELGETLKNRVIGASLWYWEAACPSVGSEADTPVLGQP